MIKAWVFEFNGAQGPELLDFNDEVAVQNTFDANIDQVVALEKLGFEGVFFSEHHFVHSLSPSPHLIIANVAARTKTLKLGVLGSVLALHQPWRVAEELGMLDYLTHGRLEIGVAAGVPPEFAFINIPTEAIRPLYEDGIAFIDEAIKSQIVTMKGRYWDFDEVPITPHLKSVGRRRKWMAVYTENSCRNAARRGYRICTGFQSNAKARIAYDAYRDEAANVGFDVTADDVGIRRTVFLAGSDAEAAERFRVLMPQQQERLMATFESAYARLTKSLAKAPSQSVLASGTMDATAGAGSGGEGLDSIVSVEDEFIFGSPKTVADKIIAQCRQLGAGHIVGIHLSTLTRAELAEHYELWGEVIPILRKAEVVLSPVRETV